MRAGGRAAGPAPPPPPPPPLAAGALVRVGAVEAPIRYWMFAPREREIEPLAALVATAATDQQAEIAAGPAPAAAATARRAAAVG